jgi:multisubunit Na+/H+ antiporter MnhB subunit
VANRFGTGLVFTIVIGAVVLLVGRADSSRAPRAAIDLRRFAIKRIVGLAILTALAALDGRGRRASPAL